MNTFPLGSLSESIDYGFTASAVPNGTATKFLRITDIQNGSIDWNLVPGCVCSGPEAQRFGLRCGDLVFARTGATTGKSVLIENAPEGSVFASYLIRVRPKPTVSPGYLAHYFKSSAYWRQISLTSTGTAQPGVNASKLAQLKIPVPPIEEQKRIAAILDRADAIRRKREQAIQLADDFLRSLFLDMFGDPVRNPKGWPTASIRNLAPNLRYGTSTKCVDQVRSNTLPVLRIPNIVTGRFNQSQLKHAELPASEVANLKLKRGDILFVRTNGNPEYIGRCAVFGSEQPMLFASYLIRARISGSECVPEFLSDQLMTDSYRKVMLNEAKTTAGNYNVSASALSNLRVILPPGHIQRRYLDLRGEFCSLTSTLEEQARLVDELVQALTHRVFNRELSRLVGRT